MKAGCCGVLGKRGRTLQSASAQSCSHSTATSETIACQQHDMVPGNELHEGDGRGDTKLKAGCCAVLGKRGRKVKSASAQSCGHSTTRAVTMYCYQHDIVPGNELHEGGDSGAA